MWYPDNQGLFTIEFHGCDQRWVYEDVVKNGETIATITPGDIEEMEDIITALDDGEDVDGWEDGMGNTIYID